MSAEKAGYPFRPQRKGRPLSAHTGGRKSKTWVSARDKVEGGRDISARLNKPWWKAPMYVEARLAKWG